MGVRSGKRKWGVGVLKGGRKRPIIKFVTHFRVPIKWGYIEA